MVGFARLLRADLDGDLLVEPLEEVQQLVRGEPAVVAVHQVRHVGLGNAEESGDLPLLEVAAFQYPVNMETDLRTGEQLVGILQPKIGKHVAGAFLDLDFRLFTLCHVSLAPVPDCQGCRGQGGCLKKWAAPAGFVRWGRLSCRNCSSLAALAVLVSTRPGISASFPRRVPLPDHAGNNRRSSSSARLLHGRFHPLFNQGGDIFIGGSRGGGDAGNERFLLMDG